LTKETIQKAKNSLLGKEEDPKPFYSYTLPKKLIPLRIALWTISIFLSMSLIIMNKNYFSLLQNAKNFIQERIQGIYLLIPGSPVPSASAISLDKERIHNITKNEPESDSEGTSQEVSK
jgi:hypothetical protein